jgi:hypothetical protein
MARQLDPAIGRVLARGVVIPAHPLALTADRRLDERRQRALTRYYVAAGAGGLAVGVHTTQFAIRDARIGLFAPVLKLAAEEMDRADRGRAEPLIRIGGICGATAQAVREAELLANLAYSAGLLSLAAMKDSEDATLIAHCRRVAELIPLIGFYLQPAVGGRVLSYKFWREFAEIENVVAIKIAPFNRYQTLDVVRAVAESGRDIALYTGNDDNIAMDLLTLYVFQVHGRAREYRIVGGLLGHWAVWTRRAVDLLQECHAVAHEARGVRKICSEEAPQLPIPTQPFSTRRTISQAASPASMRSYGVKACWKESGAWIPKKPSAPDSKRRSIASTPPIPI